MSFFLTLLNKFVNGIVPLTVMKLFQYGAKRATESTWNASERSWLLHRRGPRYRRKKNSPGFTCNTFSVSLLWGQNERKFQCGVSQLKKHADPAMDQLLEIGTSRTSLDTAGYPGHSQRLAENVGPWGDLHSSGEQPGGGRSAPSPGGDTRYPQHLFHFPKGHSCTVFILYSSRSNRPLNGRRFTH